MGRSEKANQRMRAASRQRILKHALRLFATHGYAATSMRMIAEAAGISTGLSYNYFRSKAEVLAALFEESMLEVQASFARVEAASTPAKRIEILVRDAFAVVGANRDFWRLRYGLRMQRSVSVGLGRKLDGWTTTIRATLARYLAQNGHPQPDIGAALLFAVIDGVSQHYVLDPRNYPIDEVADEIIAMFAGA